MTSDELEDIADREHVRRLPDVSGAADWSPVESPLADIADACHARLMRLADR